MLAVHEIKLFNYVVSNREGRREFYTNPHHTLRIKRQACTEGISTEKPIEKEAWQVK